jgi:hypothetical protein
MKMTDITESEWLNYVGLLTESQKNNLLGQKLDDNCFFNPFQDLNDNWVLTIQEMNYCINPNYMWVKDLDLIIFEAKPKPQPPYLNI